MGWVFNATPRPLYPQERPGIHCMGIWVGPRAGLDIAQKISPPPELDPRTVHPVEGVGDDNTIKYINTIKAHCLVSNTLYAQNVFLSLHFFISFNSSLSPHHPSQLSVLNATQLQKSACRLLRCRVTNRPLSASDWLSVRSFVLDLKCGLSWLS